MKIFSWLLWLFPYSFARDFGDEWKAANEEMLSSIQEHGTSHKFYLSVKLLWDILCHAPQAHINSIKQSILGPVPVMIHANAGPWAIVRAYGGYIFESSRNEYKNDVFTLGLGASVFLLLYVYIFQLSTQMMMDLRQYDQHFKQALLTNVQYFQVVLSVALLGFFAFSLPASYRYVRYRKGPLLRHVITSLVGFYLAMILILLASILPVSNESLHAFSRFPQTQQLLAPRPYTIYKSEWTEDQKAWFDPDTLQVRADRRDLWCATKTSWNNSEYQTLSSLSSPDVIRGLLYLSSESVLVYDGCFSSQQYFQKTRDVAQMLRSPWGSTQISWMYLSGIFMPAGVLSSHHFLVWPRLHPDVYKSCSIISMELGFEGYLTREQMESSGEFCLGMQNDIAGKMGTKVGPIDPSLLPPRWVMSDTLKSYIDATADTRVLSEQDFQTIRNKILSHYSSTP